MSMVTLDLLPGSARVWVFAASRPLVEDDAQRLLDTVDRFLASWVAHGAPLTCARDWRDDRFLTIGVDESGPAASGCSIDGLYRQLQALERSLGTNLVGGGRVFHRDESGDIVATTRDEFTELAERGAVDRSTRVFDTSVTRLGDWRERFETEAERSWHRDLLGAGATGD